jgi:hypothetical protein
MISMNSTTLIQFVVVVKVEVVVAVANGMGN